MKNLREVKYFKSVLICKYNDEFEPGKEYVGNAKFHEFGVNYEEFTNDLDGTTLIGNYSTAIIELDDGTIESIEVELIQFIDVDIKE